MENKLITCLVAIVAGGITFKAIRTAQYIKRQKELLEEIEEEARDEK